MFYISGIIWEWSSNLSYFFLGYFLRGFSAMGTVPSTKLLLVVLTLFEELSLFLLDDL
jgi:hypothetical protein